MWALYNKSKILPNHDLPQMKLPRVALSLEFCSRLIYNGSHLDKSIPPMSEPCQETYYALNTTVHYFSMSLPKDYAMVTMSGTVPS